MTFSSRVKQELCSRSLSEPCCIQAELYGVLLFCHTFEPREIRIITRSLSSARRVMTLLRKAFRMEFDEKPSLHKNWEEERVGIFVLRDPQKLQVVLDAYGLDATKLVAIHVNYGLLEEEHCQRAFFRGAFLAGGSVTDPTKSYHLELATSHYYVGREIGALLQEMGFTPKDTQRRGEYVTYFKQSQAIEDFLTVIGSPVSAMEVMTAKVERDLRGRVNRRVNCDAANLDKTVEAARAQMDAIAKLEERGMMGQLSDKLQEAARLRMEYPELNLTELAELCNPPVSKSAFNQRLKRLMEWAQ